MGKNNPQATKNVPAQTNEYGLLAKISFGLGFGAVAFFGGRCGFGCMRQMARTRQPRRREPVYWTAFSNP